MRFFIGGDEVSFWRGSLVTHGEAHHEVPILVMLAPTLAMAGGFAVAWYFYITNPLVPFGLAKRFRELYQFLLHAWYFDDLYDFLFVRPAKRIGRFLWKTGDGTVIDGIGPDGVAARVIDITNRVVKLQSGYIYHYAFVMLIGTLSLTGFPFTAGFVSKDAIIEATYAAHSFVGNYAFVLTLVAALLTSFYSWRLMFLAFEGRPREPKEVLAHAHEPPWTMGLPLAVLALGALLLGGFFAHLFIGAGEAEFWRGSLVTRTAGMREAPLWVALAPSIAMLLGFAVAWYFYITNPLVPFGLSKRFRGAYLFLLNAWYFDALYDALFVRPAKRLGRFLWKTGDGRIIDGLGPDGVSARVIDIANRAIKLQSGYIYHYAFIMLIGVALIITYFLFTGGGLKP
jgi:NADH:ubiquinone oxidoreductase subunit 5 (subunit L)/multisubunit Na+/H+ antiporter MnhA subunit